MGLVMPANTAKAFFTATLPSPVAQYHTSCECGHDLLVNHAAEVNDVPLVEIMLQGVCTARARPRVLLHELL